MSIVVMNLEEFKSWEIGQKIGQEWLNDFFVDPLIEGKKNFIVSFSDMYQNRHELGKSIQLLSYPFFFLCLNFNRRISAKNENSLKTMS